MNIKFYDGLGAFLRPFYNLFWPSTVTGRENIPDEGGFVICANHMHWRDPLFLSVRVGKRRLTYLAKAELFEKPIAKWVLGEKGLGAIPIHRGQSDLNAVRLALNTVKSGEGLGIFPQGTRSKDNSPTPLLTGTAMIAMRAGVPIVPVYIDGPYRRFRRVNVTIGSPIDISDLGRRADSATLDEVTKRIADAIWVHQKKKK